MMRSMTASLRFLPIGLLILSTALPPAFAADKGPSPEIIAKLNEAQDLQRRQRFVDALAKLDEIEAVAPKLADIYNMRGSIYLSPNLRDFAKAEEQFDKAAALQRGDLAPLFNKSELLYVKHEWPAAQAAFQKLLNDFPKLPTPIRHLVLFKRLVCEAKQNQLDAAEKTLKENFTFMDDTPAYYYSKAAIAYQKNDQKEANDWIGRAESIFNAVERSAYVDTLMEARWVPNIALPPIEKKE